MQARTLFPLMITMVTVFGPCCGSALAMGGGRPDTPALQNPQAWDEALATAAAGGLEREQTLIALARLEGSGYSPEQAGTILAPAVRAARQGLPAEWILTKIDEGALKHVPAEQLAAAASQRTTTLQRAAELVRKDAGNGAGEGLLLPTATALESGVPESALQAVFGHTGTGPRGSGQLQAIVEAGEAFHLAGLGADTVENLMLDCLEHDLRPTETLRVVRYVRESASRGMSGPQLRSSLWAGDHALRGGGAGPTQRRAGAGTGPGAAPAPGPRSGAAGSGSRGGGGPGGGHGGPR